MVTKMSAPGRSFGGVARSGWNGRRPATWRLTRGSSGPDHGSHS